MLGNENSNEISGADANSVCWDPHSKTACAASYGSTLQLIDTREMDVSLTKVKAHSGNIRYSTNSVLLIYCQ